MTAFLQYGLGDKLLPAHVRAKLAEFTGRKIGVTAGSHVHDLAALQRTVTLCKRACAARFEPRNVGFVQATRRPYQDGAVADCDGCREAMTPCHVFVPARLEG